jgi:phytoene dehydrogenase-like protein
MTARFDAIVIGGGTNGLVAATALAQAGRRVLLLERADRTGGKARVVEFAPGFHAPSLGLEAGWLPPTVARGIGLAPPPMDESGVALTVAAGDGDFLRFPRDPARVAEEIQRRSPRDASRWNAFGKRMGALVRFLEALYQLPPPDIDTRALGELPGLLGLGRKFRGLGRDGMTELLRVMPMPVQDLLDDEFETDIVKAAIAAGALRDLRQGPRSGGTAFGLLHYLVGAPAGSVRGRGAWRERPDAVVAAAEAAARKAGVAIRCSAHVARILVRDDAVGGVALESGEEITAPVVLSTADPSATIGMVDPAWLDPEFLLAVRNIRYRGCTAVLHYALDRLPAVRGLNEPEQALAGIVSLSPTLDSLERAADAAKYGDIPDVPHIELTVPTLRWPSLAPAGKHVLVARVQYAPYHLRGGGEWNAESTRTLTSAVSAAIQRVMPLSQGAGAVMTPRTIADDYALTHGGITHGELLLDQILFMRPVAGWGRYAMPIDGLYLGGSGAHPGPGVIGGAGWLAAGRALADAKRSPAGGKR